MGRLTDDMAQLRRNIDQSRESRLAGKNERVSSIRAQIAGFAAVRAKNGKQDAQERMLFVTNNINDVNRFLNDFRHTFQVMARNGHENRTAFVTDVSRQTRSLLKGFSADRKSMAERSAKDRTEFISSMTNNVAAFINDAAQDRAGAHAAFFGTSAPKKKTAFPV